MFGHIEYLNLLPFYMFLKRKNEKIKKGYPSYINKLFENKKVNAAFISSIKSENKKCFDIGIVAKKEVKSVLLCKGNGKDIESETSNKLAEVLNLRGQVVIGDKAFKYNDCLDLSKEWYKRYRLPFVFAIFCVNKNEKKYEKLMKQFLKSPPKIPYYYIKQYAKKAGISVKEAKEYLQKNIYYKIGWQEKKALKIFLKKSKKV
jgi:chorismate dehydratase